MTKLIEKTAKTEKTETKVEARPKGYRMKFYYVDAKSYGKSTEELSKAPNQVRIMMKHFAENFNSPEKAAQGRIMCQSAIEKGGLKTVIEPHILFAYYRKKMEEFGLKLKDN